MHQAYLQSNKDRELSESSATRARSIEVVSESNGTNCSENRNANLYDPDIHFPILLTLFPKK